MSDDTAPLTLTLALATEIAELRAQLTEAQDLLVEIAVDAGSCTPACRSCRLS